MSRRTDRAEREERRAETRCASLGALSAAVEAGPSVAPALVARYDALEQRATLREQAHDRWTSDVRPSAPRTPTAAIETPIPGVARGLSEDDAIRIACGVATDRDALILGVDGGQIRPRGIWHALPREIDSARRDWRHSRSADPARDARAAVDSARATRDAAESHCAKLKSLATRILSGASTLSLDALIPVAIQADLDREQARADLAGLGAGGSERPIAASAWVAPVVTRNAGDPRDAWRGSIGVSGRSDLTAEAPHGLRALESTVIRVQSAVTARDRAEQATIGTPVPVARKR